jgi:hypothetical protein
VHRKRRLAAPLEPWRAVRWTWASTAWVNFVVLELWARRRAARTARERRGPWAFSADKVGDSTPRMRSFESLLPVKLDLLTRKEEKGADAQRRSASTKMTGCKCPKESQPWVETACHPAWDFLSKRLPVRVGRCPVLWIGQPELSGRAHRPR